MDQSHSSSSIESTSLLRRTALVRVLSSNQLFDQQDRACEKPIDMMISLVTDQLGTKGYFFLCGVLCSSVLEV